MIEQQRLQYLTALGIDTYIPTRVLANAAISPALVPFEPEELDQSSLEEEPKIVEKQMPASTSQPVELESDKPIELAPDVEPPLESPTKPIPAAKPVANTTAPLRFTLSLWEITPQLIVIDTRQTGSALPTDKLLQNILRAMGYPLAQLPASELIRWPIFKEDPQANNLEEAQAMVQANVNARCAKTQGIRFMIMGEIAADFVLAPCEQYNDFEQQIGQQIELPQRHASMVVLPSLVEILEEPSRKALVWRAIQALLREHQ